MMIGDVIIGLGPCAVVAEVGCNHNGELDTALALVDECANQGADIIKFQAYLPAELLKLRGKDPEERAPAPWAGYTWRQLYERAQTPLKWFPRLAEQCAKNGIPWFSSVFGLGGLAFLEAIECPAYKLAALDYGSRSLRSAVESTGKPIIRSTPGPRSKAFELWCPPGYPQNLEGAPLRANMRKYQGFSYHGTDPIVPALAVAYGAQMVEVHVQLDDQPSVLDAHSSLTVTELGLLVQWARAEGRLA